MLRQITGIILFFFNSEFKFLLMHESNFHVTGFSYGSNTRDAVRRVSCSQADFDVAATTSRCILVTIASTRAPRAVFQHSSPTLGPGILAATVGTSTWRASPAVGNASMDDTGTLTTFFFVTGGKGPYHGECLLILIFVIWALVERLSNSSIDFLQRPSSSARRDFADVILNVGGSGEGDGGGNDIDAAPWWLGFIVLWYMTKYCVMMTMYYHDDYGLSWTVSKLILSLLNIFVTYFGGSSSGRQPKQALYKKTQYIHRFNREHIDLYSSINREIYGTRGRGARQV
jgi:hypothetical protein